MTGFMGRVGIYETLVASPAVKQLIAAGAELARVREQAMKEGMKPLRVSGAMKIAAGLTTMDEVLKVAPPVRDAAL
jgi:general secretion pathway protein E